MKKLTFLTHPDRGPGSFGQGNSMRRSINPKKKPQESSSPAALSFLDYINEMPSHAPSARKRNDIPSLTVEARRCKKLLNCLAPVP